MDVCASIESTSRRKSVGRLRVPVTMLTTGAGDEIPLTPLSPLGPEGQPSGPLWPSTQFTCLPFLILISPSAPVASAGDYAYNGVHDQDRNRKCATDFSEIESELHWVKTIYEPHLTPAERTELLATAEAFRNVLRKLNARHVDPRSSMDGY